MRHKCGARRATSSNVDFERCFVGYCISQSVDVSAHLQLSLSIPTSSTSLIEASLIIITGSLPTMRLFLNHVAPSWVNSSEATRPSTVRQEHELQHQGAPDPYDIEDGASEREILGKGIQQ